MIPKPENLKQPEILSANPEQSAAETGGIGRAEVEQIYGQRKKSLEQVRPLVCLKFYNEIAEKLQREQRLFAELLNWHDSRQQALSQYSFVLNPYYFEQQLL